jgi:hypothetical protein
VKVLGEERAVARKPLLLQMILKSTFWLPK